GRRARSVVTGAAFAVRAPLRHRQIRRKRVIGQYVARRPEAGIRAHAQREFAEPALLGHGPSGDERVLVTERRHLNRPWVAGFVGSCHIDDGHERVGQCTPRQRLCPLRCDHDQIRVALERADLGRERAPLVDFRKTIRKVDAGGELDQAKQRDREPEVLRVSGQTSHRHRAQKNENGGLAPVRARKPPFFSGETQPAVAEPLADALAFTDTLICTEASACALIEEAKQAPTLSAASASEVTTACAPSSEALTLAVMPSSLPFMPMVTLSSAGRFFSSAALTLAAAAASAAASILADTTAGLHSTLPFTSALQCALHSALISGGLTSPLHFGSLNSTLQPPEQVPSHLPLALTEQVALHSPLHSALHTASALPVHLPSQVPAHLPLVFLPSHLPSQVPSHLPEISPVHSPLQVPPQVPSHLAPASSSQVPSHLASHLPLSL